ncbi:MAG: hypothetical protein J0I93_14120 [Legionella sp.]|nr:hypothetical protein [Legionella sp.]
MDLELFYRLVKVLYYGVWVFLVLILGLGLRSGDLDLTVLFGLLFLGL